MRDMIFNPGDACGAFCILSFVGCGGTSDVYKAVHVATQEVVALKCRRLSDICDSYVVDHILAESELLSKLSHDNVVRVQDVGIDNGVLWMAMEFLSGVTLRGLLKQSRALPLPTALYYAREIAEGLSAIHKMRVVHRDLKPDNVMITTQNKAKVLDTGAAKFFGGGMRETRPGTIFAPPLYVSPEHLHELSLDGRADVYSLGLTLFEMIAGRHPLIRKGEEGLSRHEIIVRQLRVDPPPLARVVRGVPSYVSDLVKRAVAKDRDERPASMDEFAREVESALTAFVKETQAIFALPQIARAAAPAARFSGTGHPHRSKNTDDTTDDNAATIDLRAFPPEPPAALPEPAQEPVAAAAARANGDVWNTADDEMDSRQTIPLFSERHAAPAPAPSSPATLLSPVLLRTTKRSAQFDDPRVSQASFAAPVPASLLHLEDGWSASLREPTAEIRLVRSLKLPVVLASIIMALSVGLLVAHPGFTQPSASALTAAPLVDARALAPAFAQPGVSSLVEKATTLHKQDCGWRWRREDAPSQSEPLAGSRQYPSEEPVTAPRSSAVAYSPGGI